MKKLVILGLFLLMVACSGSSSSSGGNDGGDSGGGNGGGGNGDGAADYYLRYARYVGTELNITVDSYNPVFDYNTEDYYKPGEVVRLDVLANGTSTSVFLSTVNDSRLVLLNIGSAVLLNLQPIETVIQNLLGGSCSLNSNTKAAIIELKVQNQNEIVYKVGYRGDVSIFYEYVYVDSDVNVNCNFESQGNFTVNSSMALKSGWNEIRYSDYDITNITAEEEYWLVY